MFSASFLPLGHRKPGFWAVVSIDLGLQRTATTGFSKMLVTPSRSLSRHGDWVSSDSVREQAGFFLMQYVHPELHTSLNLLTCSANPWQETSESFISCALPRIQTSGSQLSCILGPAPGVPACTQLWITEGSSTFISSPFFTLESVPPAVSFSLHPHASSCFCPFLSLGSYNSFTEEASLPITETWFLQLG